MKLYTKIFLSFFILIAAAFCLCGTWMISASFDAAKKREIQMGMSRNELYRTTFRSAADSVPADYFTTHHSLREIVVALKDGMDDKNGAFCLYDENKNIVLRRGKGLMQGLVLKTPVGDTINKAIEKGLLVISAAGNVLRLLPPLIITKENVDEMINILKECI